MVEFFNAQTKSPEWQLRNAALVAFAGLLDERAMSKDKEELVAAKLEAVGDLLDDPVIEVRSTAAWVLSQVCVCSSASLLSFGPDAI